MTTLLQEIPNARSGSPQAPLSVYVHFPYCLHRCAYCDFATAVAREIPREAYRLAIETELRIRTRDLAPRPISTVFFGGGTPSLWGPDHVGLVLAWLDRWGGLPPGAEVTLEANPGATETGALRGYAAAGVNRVSIGVQALEDRRLRALDRLHDAATARSTLAELGGLVAQGVLRSASADLIFGGPGQTLQDLQADVRGVLDHGLPHLSAYSLTVEAGTPLHERVARGLQAAPDDGLQGEMLEALPGLAAGYGLDRYEVSNFAKPGHTCAHNLAYWTGQHYLAVGVGAHGYLPAGGRAGLCGVRYGNARGHRDWLAALERGELCEELREDIDPDSHLSERLLTGLRLEAGLDLQRLRTDVGGPLVDGLLARARSAQRQGVPVDVEDGHLRLRPQAMRWLDRAVLALA